MFSLQKKGPILRSGRAQSLTVGDPLRDHISFIAKIFSNESEPCHYQIVWYICTTHAVCSGISMVPLQIYGHSGLLLFHTLLNMYQN